MFHALLMCEKVISAVMRKGIGSHTSFLDTEQEVETPTGHP
jgi:hypothetical protein